MASFICYFFYFNVVLQDIDYHPSLGVSLLCLHWSKTRASRCRQVRHSVCDSARREQPLWPSLSLPCVLHRISYMLGTLTEVGKDRSIDGKKQQTRPEPEPKLHVGAKLAICCPTARPRIHACMCGWLNTKLRKTTIHSLPLQVNAFSICGVFRLPDGGCLVTPVTSNY